MSQVIRLHRGTALTPPRSHKSFGAPSACLAPRKRANSTDGRLGRSPFRVACELHRDWRNDIEGVGNRLSNHIPPQESHDELLRQKVSRASRCPGISPRPSQEVCDVGPP